MALPRKPCATCLKRNHPDICIYSHEPAPRLSSNAESTHQSERHQGLSSTQDAASEAHGNPTSFLGENSAASYLRQMGGAESPIAREIVPVLGLRNTQGQYPFINAETEDEKGRELAKLLPTHQETLNFYHFYRTVSFPLSPLIVDVEGFEDYLGDFLEASVGCDPAAPRLASEREDAARIALILATLAAGAQYSDRASPDRRRISRNFAKRSFHALRLANFLLRPLLTSLQALLILGTFLQNDGNSDAAWALLGTTLRLAQSLGLHSEYGVAENVSHEDKATRRRLWMTIVQQDCILSLCYDRPTALAYMPIAVSGNHEQATLLSYQEIMWEVSRLGLNLLARRTGEANVDSMQQQLREVEQVMLRAAMHLRGREHCKGLQQRVQFYCVTLHRSFLTSAICRPTFRKSQRTSTNPQHLNVSAIGKNALAEAVKAFLDLHSLSMYPTRSWVCLHEALSSALLLTILGETRKSPTLNNMQKRLIEVLLSSALDESPQNSSYALTSSHLKALKTLQSLTLATAETDPAIPSDRLQSPAFEQFGGFDSAGDAMFDLLQTDLSPMAFLDSIIWGESEQSALDSQAKLTSLQTNPSRRTTRPFWVSSSANDPLPPQVASALHLINTIRS